MTNPLITVDDLNAVLQRTAFLDGYSFAVMRRSSGECQLAVPFERSLERPGGIVSGMTIMGAADVAMWLVIMTLRGLDEHWVTSDMKTAFLRPAVAEELLCSAKIVSQGRRTSYGTVESAGSKSGIVAHHVLTYVLASTPTSREAAP